MQVQVGLIIVNLVSGVEETVITTNKRSISNLPEEKQFTVYPFQIETLTLKRLGLLPKRLEGGGVAFRPLKGVLD